MSSALPPFRDRNPSAWQAIAAIRDRIGPLKQCWRDLRLEDEGIAYTNFSSYMRGRTQPPGFLVALLAAQASWDWLWGQPLNLRIEIYNAVLSDPTSKAYLRFRAIDQYLTALREVCEVEGHRRLASDLRRRYDADQYPLEAVCIDHKDCLLADGIVSQAEDPAAWALHLENWDKLRLDLARIESMGYWLDELHLAIVRDRANAHARGPAREFRDRRRIRQLQMVRDDLIESLNMATGPMEACFHYFSFVNVCCALKDQDGAERALARLHNACMALGADADSAAGFWLRHDVAAATISGEFGTASDKRRHLVAACKRFRHLPFSAWELRLQAELIEGVVPSD